MLKRLWQKIKQNHLLMMVVCCLVPILLVIGFLLIYKGDNNYLVWLILLLCPLIHIFIMKEHKNDESFAHKDSAIYKCPECGLEYKDKEWAEKCESWCKKHKTCNLEIIKHAIKN